MGTTAGNRILRLALSTRIRYDSKDDQLYEEVSMKVIFRLAMSFGFACAMAACGDDVQGSADVGASDLGATVDTIEADVPACNIDPTLESLSENYFSKSCNFGSCHGAGKAGGLDLTGDAHAALVNVPAVFAGAAANGKILVIPGDPDNSYLVQKIEGPDPGEGGIMPLGASTPMDPECRIKMVRQWIAEGANP